MVVKTMSYTFSSWPHDEVIHFLDFCRPFAHALASFVHGWRDGAHEACIDDVLLLILNLKSGSVGEIVVHFGEGYKWGSKCLSGATYKVSSKTIPSVLF